MVKKYWYWLFRLSAVVVLLFVTFNHLHTQENMNEGMIGVENLIKERRYSEAIDLIINISKYRGLDYDSIQKLGDSLNELPLDEINKIFTESFRKYPEYAEELNIAWAWLIFLKGECLPALNKLEKTKNVYDRFWVNLKQNILDSCQQR